MDPEQNKAVIRRYIDELNRRNEAVIDEVVAEGFAAGTLFGTGGELELIEREGAQRGQEKRDVAERVHREEEQHRRRHE